MTDATYRKFLNEGNVAEKCCDTLLHLSEECHNTLVETRIVAGGYENQAVDIIKRGFGVWSSCSSLVSCERKTNVTCGKQMVGKVFHNKGHVPNRCCRVLLQKEKRYHTVHVSERIIAGGYETNATLVIRASDALCNKCSSGN